jgi:hypothetical protein
MRRKRNRVRRLPGFNNGGRFNVSPNPNAFTAVPWYPLTLRVQTGTLATVSTGLVYNELQSQLGISSPVFTVRLKSVRFWGSVQSSPPSSTSIVIFDILASTFSTILSTAGRVLDVLIDYPDALNRSSIGYRYPQAQRDVALRLETANTITLFNMVGMGTDSVLLIDLEWRANFSAPPQPTIADDVVDVEKLYRGQLVTNSDGVISNYSEKFLT